MRIRSGNQQTEGVDTLEVPSDWAIAQPDSGHVSVTPSGSLPSASIVNVMDPAYGAAGNGTDDVSAINAAVAATPIGGTLIFPAGKTFGLASQLTISKAITVYAYGATFIPLSATGRIQIGASNNLLSDAHWYGGRFDNTASGYTSGSSFVMSWWIKERATFEDFSWDTSDDSIVISGDGRTTADAAITAASTTLTSATAAFTAADVGKRAFVYGAGDGGLLHETLIASFTNATTVELLDAAKTTVAGASFQVMTPTRMTVRNVHGANAKRDGFRFNTTCCYCDVYDSSVRVTNTVGGAAAFYSSEAPHISFYDCSAANVTQLGFRLIGPYCRAVHPVVKHWGAGNHGIRLSGEGCELVNPDVSGSVGGYGIRITNNNATGTGVVQSPHGCKVIGGTVKNCGGIYGGLSVGAPTTGTAGDNCQIIGTHVEGSTQDGITFDGGSHHAIDAVVKNCARYGVQLNNVTDCEVDVHAYDNQAVKTQQYGVITLGTADRNTIRGTSRAADHTTGGVSLVGANNNVQGLIGEANGGCSPDSPSIVCFPWFGVAATPLQAANDLLLMQAFCSGPFTPAQFRILMTAIAAGNYDVVVYSQDLKTRIWRLGVTAIPGTTGTKAAAVTATLQRGTYWLGVWSDTVSLTLEGNVNQMTGAVTKRLAAQVAGPPTDASAATAGDRFFDVALTLT